MNGHVRKGIQVCTNRRGAHSIEKRSRLQQGSARIKTSSRSRTEKRSWDTGKQREEEFKEAEGLVRNKGMIVCINTDFPKHRLSHGAGRDQEAIRTRSNKKVNIQDGVVVLELDLELEDPDSNPR